MRATRHSTPESHFDLIVIGAGINGAGIARDAAMRGLKVLLLDKGDIGGGASSASTRLIHGGLRYLEHGEFRLVRESLREREVLFRIAPHLVRPLPILIPIYKGARRWRWTIRAGLIAYDALSRGKSLPRHRTLPRGEAIERAPELLREGLRGAALYYDAQVEFAERLVLENAIAASDNGASIVTYARVDKVITDDGVTHGVEFVDLRSNETRTVTAEIIVNAAGPWVDQVAGALGVERMIGGTKGSHIVVAPFRGAPETALYVEAKTDGRPFFIIPWNTNYLIGTTDIRYDGDLDAVAIDVQEIDYLLWETNRVIPGAKLARESILFTYSGVRPLAYSRDSDEQSITRKHFVRDHAPRPRRFISIIGGKLTTYRSLAEQTVNLVSQQLKRDPREGSTAQVPLPGAAVPDFARFCEQFKKESGLPQRVSDRLLRIYGTRAAGVGKLAAEDPRLAHTFDHETGAIAAEVVFSFREEFAQTLSDCLLRRTMVGFNSLGGIGADERAARIAQQYLGWTSDRVRSEVENYRERGARASCLLD